MQKVILFLLVIYVFISCNNHVPSNNIININEVHTRSLYMSDYFDSIEYIPLETTAECLLGNRPQVYPFSDFIVVLDRECLLFERPSGKFIRKIAQKGKGPGEYDIIPKGIIINEQNISLYLKGGMHLLEYSLMDTISSPRSTYFPHHFVNLSGMACLSDSLWVVGELNLTGNIPNQLLFSDREQVVDSIPNHYLFTPKTNAISINPGENQFYRYLNDVYYKNLYNDTIFKIVDRKLQPAWILNMGVFQPPYTLKEDQSTLFEELKKYYLVHSIIETDRFLFLPVKHNQSTKLYLFGKQENELLLLESGEQNGFINDIDGGPAFWPDNTNQNQELVKVYQPYEMTEKIADKFHSQTINGSKAHENLKKMV